MGWAGGSYVANDLWEGLRDLLPPEDQGAAALCIINTLEAHDWDTQDEAPELMAAAFGPKWWEEYS